MTSEEYIKTINVNGIEIKLGLDDYGQQYFIEWEDSEGKHETGLGAYNTNYMLYILYTFDPEYKRISKEILNGIKLSEEDNIKFKYYTDLISKEYDYISER